MFNTKTKNESFIYMWHHLQDKNIENNIFMLRLDDKSLIDFDVSQLYTDDKEKRTKLLEKVVNECKNNIWFFFREVVRIPNILSMDVGWKSNTIRFVLNKDLLILIYAYEHKFSILTKSTMTRGYTTLIYLLEIYEKFINNNFNIFYAYDIKEFALTSILYANFHIINTIEPKKIMYKEHISYESRLNLNIIDDSVNNKSIEINDSSLLVKSNLCVIHNECIDNQQEYANFILNLYSIFFENKINIFGTYSRSEKYYVNNSNVKNDSETNRCLLNIVNRNMYEDISDNIYDIFMYDRNKPNKIIFF